MPDNEKLNEMRYEALAAMISQQHEEDKGWRKEISKQMLEFKTETKETLSELKAYNVKQNGSISKALNKIADLEKQNVEHVLNCPVAPKVEALEKEDLQHIINCPVAPKVEVLEKEAMGTKAIKKFIMISSSVTVALITIIWIGYQLVSKFIESGGQ